jgi:hypothetical protein
MSGHADKILSLMGEGTFGRVLECWDRKRKETVAIKVIRSVPKYREAAMIEVRCCVAWPNCVGPGLFRDLVAAKSD